VEQLLTAPAGVLCVPDGGARCAALVLSGSSGRVETDRVRLLAGHGAAAMSLRWFGDAGQPPGVCEVSLETFGPALDRLAALHDHLAIVGTSKGAEAALLLAVRDPRIRAVAALSPPSVVWANVGPGSDGRTEPYRSSWTDRGTPLPFVPYDDQWTVPDHNGAPAYRGLYEQSLATFADQADAATIPVEHIAGDLLVTGGGDDQVWPSDQFVHQIVQRRSQHRLATRVVTHPAAGHRVRLPGEPVAPANAMAMARGGTRHADEQLGFDVWRELVDLLHLSAGYRIQ